MIKRPSSPKPTNEHDSSSDVHLVQPPPMRQLLLSPDIRINSAEPIAVNSLIIYGGGNLHSMSPSMRRSVPTLANNTSRHLSSPSPSSSSTTSTSGIHDSVTSSSSRAASGTTFGQRHAKSFKEKSTRSASHSSSSGTSTSIDTRHIQLYLKKRDSRTSITSSSGTAADASGSRPLSAESNESGTYGSGSGGGARRITISGYATTASLSRTDGFESTVDTNRRHHSQSKISDQHGNASPPGQQLTAAINIKTVNVLPNSKSKRSESTPSSAANSPAPIGGGMSAIVETANADDSKPPIVRQNTAPQLLLRPKSHYINELVWQIDDWLFCGGIDAASNLNLLCRLNIEYIVDLSGLDDSNLPRSKRSECPCLCARPTAHSRATMAINVNGHQGGGQDITTYFQDVAAFIAKARACQKCVLVHSNRGRNRAPAFTVAYVMHEKRMSRQEAIALVTQCYPNMIISDHLQRALVKWQHMLGIATVTAAATVATTTNDTKQSDSAEASAAPSFATTKRSAWT